MTGSGVMELLAHSEPLTEFGGPRSNDAHRTVKITGSGGDAVQWKRTDTVPPKTRGGARVYCANPKDEISAPYEK